MKNIFRFKQFEVDQTGCGMKINTDGVLLAALAENDLTGRILDIGTGTGVMALMLAQRFLKAEVEAVEIDQQATERAAENFKQSVFRHRLKAKCVAIENYSTPQQFDLIVSNPPFFVNDLKNTEEKKGMARHASTEFFEQLILKIKLLLNVEGAFWVILPVKQAKLLTLKAIDEGFFVRKKIMLHSDQHKDPFRYILCFVKTKHETVTEHFYIYEKEKVYTPEYRALLKDFFLGY